MKIGLRTIKTALGAVIAMVLAYELRLDYWATAGIITILSVQNTTRYSFSVAGLRIGATILSFALAIFSFWLLGFNPWAFGLFLLLFIPLAMQLHLQEGIVVSAVLVTHFLLQKSYSWHWLSNEFTLMLIGVGVALIFNLFMPSLMAQIKGFQQAVEDELRQILLQMAQQLAETPKVETWQHLGTLLTTIRKGREWASRQQDNQLLVENDFYRSYFEMRRNQYEMLRQMQANLDQITLSLKESTAIRELLAETAAHIAQPQKIKHLQKSVAKLQNTFDQAPLPTNRAEFESRAHLYLFLLDFETLLTLAGDFYEKVVLTEK
ncbi:aromatic acid exporter family protein [Loigolactobacillus zhaoyuanensis]|uniref:Aromatic acid exporter family protein n=1 Tax=Loigolactobacillus zhaoyuanensis TaxID=2486017 RepID=A0ABW8UCE4_9LACO|nr:aromatic acid exporter family protein [Loigolactobacillus zhaoyuanensis]